MHAKEVFNFNWVLM